MYSNWDMSTKHIFQIQKLKFPKNLLGIIQNEGHGILKVTHAS